MQDNISVPNGDGIIDQAQFEADKRAVYKHPLFSLLALLLEKCEQATQGYISSQTTIPNQTKAKNVNSIGSNSISKDIETFVQLLEKEKRPLLTDNAELDGLMIKALQVLRIHLLELEKVQELCKDFCTRYIACLRGKMQSENLLRSDYPLETNNNNNNMSNSNSPIHSPDQEHSACQSNFYSTDLINSSHDGGDYNNLIGGNFNVQSNLDTNMNNNSNNVHDVYTNIQNKLSNEPKFGALQSKENLLMNIQTQNLIDKKRDLLLGDQSGSDCSEIDSDIDSNNDEITSNFSSTSSAKRLKRGILPKQATSVMRAWLFQHLVHPYPTEDEKRTIAAQTNLTLLQVNNWFINARRRILQPMLENTGENILNQSEVNSTKKLQDNSSTEQNLLNSFVENTKSCNMDLSNNINLKTSGQYSTDESTNDSFS